MTYDDAANDYDALIAHGIANLSPRWGVRGYRALNMSGGVAFTFTLLDGRKAVATVEDNGNGGGAWPRWHDGWKSPAALAWAAECERVYPGDGGGSESLIEALLQRAGK